MSWYRTCMRAAGREPTPLRLFDQTKHAEAHEPGLRSLRDRESNVQPPHASIMPMTIPRYEIQESRNVDSVCIWIPGPLASLAVRDDKLGSSCPALCRASTSEDRCCGNDVDGRAKPGHDASCTRASYLPFDLRSSPSDDGVKPSSPRTSSGAGEGGRLSMCGRYREASGPQSKYSPVPGSSSSVANSRETSRV